jgi:hypothetical protein
MEVNGAGASVGSMLAGRLTAELIRRSPQYMNCINMYHLDLRGASCRVSFAMSICLLGAAILCWSAAV